MCHTPKPYVDENGNLRFREVETNPSNIFSGKPGPIGRRGASGYWALLFNPDDHMMEIRENTPLMRLLTKLDKDDRRRLQASVAQLRQIKAELSCIADTLVEREAVKSGASPEVYTFAPACDGIECVSEHIETLLAACRPYDSPFPGVSPELRMEIAELVRKNIREQLSPMPASRTGDRYPSPGDIIGVR